MDLPAKVLKVYLTLINNLQVSRYLQNLSFPFSFSVYSFLAIVGAAFEIKTGAEGSDGMFCEG